MGLDLAAVHVYMIPTQRRRGAILRCPQRRLSPVDGNICNSRLAVLEPKMGDINRQRPAGGRFPDKVIGAACKSETSSPPIRQNTDKSVRTIENFFIILVVIVHLTSTEMQNRDCGPAQSVNRKKLTA